tara:strand:+ start:285 stop:860 length:576 start_codon:yes stop_codon:yes gene_type:complete
MRSLSVITAATTDILTLAEAKAHLKVDTTADDTLITTLIKSATQSAEQFTNMYFITTDVKQYCDTWTDVQTLYKSPVQSINVIKYYDNDNTLQTLASSVYLLDDKSKPARVTTDVDQNFPTLADRTNAIEVRYDVGFGDAASDVPEIIKQAVLLIIGNWYANRESVITGRTTTEMPLSSQYILGQYKIQVI